jgi:hypothetical protein
MAVRLSALRAGRYLLPGRFLVLISVRDWVDPRGHSSTGMIRSIKQSNALIGNRTRDLAACSSAWTKYHMYCGAEWSKWGGRTKETLKIQWCQLQQCETMVLSECELFCSDVCTLWDEQKLHCSVWWWSDVHRVVLWSLQLQGTGPQAENMPQLATMQFGC